MDIRKPLRASILAKIALFTALFSLVPVYLVTTVFIIVHRHFLWYGLCTLSVLTVVLLSGAYLFARHLTQPILALRRAVERIAQGDFTTVVDISTTDELQDLATTFNTMSEELKFVI